MALVTEMDLPEFDFLDPELRGERFHRTVQELAARSWVARSPLAYFVFDREAGELFLRTRSAGFPGPEIQEMFDVTDTAIPCSGNVMSDATVPPSEVPS